MGNVNWFGRWGRVAPGRAIPPRPPLRTEGLASHTGDSRPPYPPYPPAAPPYPPDPVHSAPPEPHALVTIDALGRKCPIPIIMLAEQIRDVPVGGVIAVLADDPAAYTDVPAWCQMKSHECVFRTDLASGWSFGIRRRY
jgi:tRNA 2-thiouridine synthesizing protein A